MKTSLEQCRKLARVNLEHFLTDEVYDFVANALVNLAPRSRFRNRPLVRKACNAQDYWTSTRVECMVKYQVIRYLVQQGLDLDSLKTIGRDELNLTKHQDFPPKVIHNGMIKEYVGIGWIQLETATLEDYKNYPVVTQ